MARKMERERDGSLKRQIVHRRAICVLAGAAAAWTTTAHAAQYIYVPPAAPDTTSWSAGTGAHFNALPVGGMDTEITFGSTSTAPTYSTGAFASTNDLTGPGGSTFKLNILDLGGTGSTTTAASTMSISGTTLEFVASSASVNPTINLSGNAGTKGLVYTVSNPLLLDNDTTISGSGSASFVFNGPFTATGVAITKTGTSSITFSGLTTAASFGSTGLTFVGGALSLTMSGSGAATLTSADSNANSVFTYGSGFLNLSKGTSSSLVYTVGNASATGSVLSRQNNGVLIVRALTSLGSGTGEEFKVNGTAPAVNAAGMVNASIIGNGTFLTYNSSTGFAAATTTNSGTTLNTGAGTANQIIKTSAVSVTINGGGSIGALITASGQAATLTGTVTVGDGTNPAGIIMNGNTATGVTPITGGTVAFGNSEGVIYAFNSNGTPSTLNIASAITGNNGLTVAAAQGSLVLGGTVTTGTINAAMGTLRTVTGQDWSSDVLTINPDANVNAAAAFAIAGLNNVATGPNGQLNTNGGAVMIVGSGVYSFAGNDNGSNPILMNGSGTQTLSGNLTNAGVTLTVNNGTVVYNGTSSAGAIVGGSTTTASTTATLTGTGSFARAITVNGAGTFSSSATSAGHLSPGTGSSSGTMTAATATFNSGAILDYYFAANGGGTSESSPGTSSVLSLTTGTGTDATFAAGNDTVTLNLAGGTIVQGVYKLMSFASSTTPAANFTNGDGTTTGTIFLGSGWSGFEYSYSIVSENHGIYLNVIPEPSSICLIALPAVGLLRRRSRRGRAPS